jgi:hypothetical protein
LTTAIRAGTGTRLTAFDAKRHQKVRRESDKIGAKCSVEGRPRSMKAAKRGLQK